MNFLHYRVITRPGASIRVHLAGNAANVRVMDDINFQKYQQGLQHTYYGGYYTMTPVVIRPAISGNLNVVVDLGGLPGTVNALVEVLP